MEMPELLAQCLINRDLSTPDVIENFLNPRLKNLSDPFFITGMKAAVDRLFQARARHENVVIFGDYDVDGVTSTTLLREASAALGWKISHFVPHRLDEGYGLTHEGVENCLKQHPCTLLLVI